MGLNAAHFTKHNQRIREEYPRGSSTVMETSLRAHGDKPGLKAGDTVECLATKYGRRNYADHGIFERVLIRYAGGIERWVDTHRVAPCAEVRLRRGTPERHLEAAGV